MKEKKPMRPSPVFAFPIRMIAISLLLPLAGCGSPQKQGSVLPLAMAKPGTTPVKEIAPPDAAQGKLGISYDAALRSLTDRFAMEPVTAINGLARYKGLSLGKGVALELIGDKANLTCANLLIFLPQDEETLAGTPALIARFAANVLPGWTGGGEKLLGMIEQAKTSLDPVTTVVTTPRGSENVRVQSSKETGTFLVSVSQK